MEVQQRIEKFNKENEPFYLVDHGEGVYSLCLPLSILKDECSDFCQEAFNQYALRIGEPVMDGRFYTHGNGHEWRTVFEKAFEGEETLKHIVFDCEAGGFYCYSYKLEVLEDCGKRFRELCMNTQKFAELVDKALSENKEQTEKKISANEMSPFLVAVAEMAKKRGFEVEEISSELLYLNLKGKFVAMVDESGSMGYHPYKEVLDIVDEVSKLRKSIPIEEPEQGIQINM